MRRVAVASRSAERAAAFAREFAFERSYGSYQELVRDRDVEIVYVATPHPFHLEHAILCLENGKHVICEKPLAMNAAEARMMAEVSRTNARFLVEATFSRWMPSWRKVRQWIDEGRIGPVRMMWANAGGRGGFGLDPADRHQSLALGAGTLLDVGCYAVSFVHYIMGTPARILAAGKVHPFTGIDEHSASIFEYSDGRLAVVSTGGRTPTTNDAVISGAYGQITLPGAHWGGQRAATLKAGHDEPLTFAETPEDQLYPAADWSDHEKSWMIADVMACVAQGRLECPTMPLNESIAIAESLDAIRRQIGLGVSRGRGRVWRVGRVARGCAGDRPRLPASPPGADPVRRASPPLRIPRSGRRGLARAALPAPAISCDEGRSPYNGGRPHKITNAAAEPSFRDVKRSSHAGFGRPSQFRHPNVQRRRGHRDRSA